MTLEINRLLQHEHDPEKRRILKRLKILNKRAYKHMMQPYKTYNQKYTSLQKKPCWAEAKTLLKQYKDDLRCPLCMSNSTNDFVLHHKEYEPRSIFTPSFVQFVHKACHQREHGHF